MHIHNWKVMIQRIALTLRNYQRKLEPLPSHTPPHTLTKCLKTGKSIKNSCTERGRIARRFIWTCTWRLFSKVCSRWQLFNLMKWLFTPDLCHSTQRSGVHIYILKPWRCSLEKKMRQMGFRISARNLICILVMFLT